MSPKKRERLIRSISNYYSRQPSTAGLLRSAWVTDRRWLNVDDEHVKQLHRSIPTIAKVKMLLNLY